MHEVGWPDPAAVVSIIERMLRRRAFSFTVSIAVLDGPAGDVMLMESSFKWLADVQFYLFQVLSASRESAQWRPPFSSRCRMVGENGRLNSFHAEKFRIALRRNRIAESA